jgi:hypothetical protein
MWVSSQSLRPSGAALILIGQKDDQAYRAGREPCRYLGVESMLFIDIADEFYRFHGSIFHSSFSGTQIIANLSSVAHVSVSSVHPRSTQAWLSQEIAPQAYLELLDHPESISYVTNFGR